MIKFKVEKNCVECEAVGGLLQNVAEIGIAICSLYNQLNKTNAEAARIFKIAVCGMVTENAPIWLPIEATPDVYCSKVIDIKELIKQMREDKP